MQTPSWPPDHHSAWLDVDLDALEFNYHYIKQQIAPSRIIAVVKAYGLGIGAVAAARKFESLGVYMLAVSNFHEATYLRKHGIQCPILVMSGLLPGQMDVAIRLHLSFFGFDEPSLRTADALGRDLGRPARIHLKVDTGLGRLGILPGDAVAIREVLAQLDWIDVEGVASHVASPIQPEHDDFTRLQYQAFLEACEILDPDHRTVHHFASSNTLPRLSEINADAVRCQAILWGWAHYWPLPWPLRPAASFKARVVQVKELPRGHNVGYRLLYTTDRPTRLAVASIGVVDGMKGEHAGGGYVLIRGRRCPIIGMCSCVMMVDVTGVEDAEAGDEIVLIGTQGSETLTAVDFGLMGQSSFMSVMAMISPRVPRRYWDGGEYIGSEIFCETEDWEF